MFIIVCICFYIEYYIYYICVIIAAELQAIDRTHRFGQHAPIHATRFIMANTIEERILLLQNKKMLVFNSTIGGDNSNMNKLTIDDLRFLFQ